MEAGGAARLFALTEEIRAEFPRFRIVRKADSPFQRLIHRALWAVTLGGMRSYLDGYVTTMGQAVYVPAGWDDEDPDHQVVTLRHERVHMRQFARLTFPGMAILYLLLPVPMGLAYARARLEWAAYRETIRATYEIYGPVRIRQPGFREHIIAQFTGPSYGWMWPFRSRIEAWYHAAIAELEQNGAA
ncbi:MAG TPA: hypothetical protein VFG83_11045 [Kofleriaceae bacterium]|nr:hypothetical protein [Kofleriaceae bacterium]